MWSPIKSKHREISCLNTQSVPWCIFFAEEIFSNAYDLPQRRQNMTPVEGAGPFLPSINKYNVVHLCIFSLTLQPCRTTPWGHTDTQEPIIASNVTACERGYMHVCTHVCVSVHMFPETYKPRWHAISLCPWLAHLKRWQGAEPSRDLDGSCDYYATIIQYPVCLWVLS